jgi:beta-galactosidase
LLIGTFPGGGYYLHHSASARSFFADLLKLANVDPKLRTNNSTIQARLHSGKGGNYLWVVNPSRAEAKVTVSLNTDVSARTAEDIWGGRPITIDKRSMTVSVPARDAAVIALR